MYKSEFSVLGRRIAADAPTYFIADVASNHDGDLERAKALIWLAKDAGADAVKFQHFKAKTIVSDAGFKAMGQITHQAGWRKSVYEIYQDCELNRAWDGALAETAARADIHFMTSPYDAEAIATTAALVAGFKIGSGEITWVSALEDIARAGKPVFLATGAASMEDVERAVEAITAINPAFCLMQCNTNYTGSIDNFRYINLRVIETYARRWPGMVLGLSDHTPGHATVLGAVALGARVVEKHFTDDNGRTGPDHGFSMTPVTWREMVDRTRELELALGDGVKRVEENERDPALVQRRCLRLVADRPAGHRLNEGDLEALRPAPLGSVEPYGLAQVIGQALKQAKKAGEALLWADVDHA